MSLRVLKPSPFLGALLAGLAALSAAAAEPVPPVAPAAVPGTAVAPPTAVEVPAQVAAPVAALVPAPASASTFDDQARFLAGLPVSAGSPLAAWQDTPDYRDHVATMDKQWKLLSDRLDKASDWQQAELAPRIQGRRNLIYFFGGPDAAHAVKLFPGAPIYLLAGLEPVGEIEAPEKMKFSQVHKAIDRLASSLTTFMERSFFRTTEMGSDFQGHGIKGILPVLALMLARSGATIDDIAYFEVDAKGVANVRPASQKWGPGVPGVRVRFHVASQAPQEMLYVRVNLYNDDLARQPGFLAWARSFGPANSFLKAASFILHDSNFSKVRSLLLETSAAVVEDDSGIPYRAFPRGEWEYTCFGKYVVPRKPFGSYFQEDLDKACKAMPARPLPFMIGYRRPDDTFLLLAVRKGGAAPAWAPAAIGVPEAAPAMGPVPAATNAVPAPAPAPATPPAR